MTPRRKAVPHPLRVCIRCHGVIAEQRPPYLVGLGDGRIVGPFHAGCAERLSIEAEKRPGSNWLKGAAEVGTWPTRREETLPW